MKNYTPKYATMEQVEEINKLCEEGHGEALLALCKDCIHERDKVIVKGCLIGAGVGFGIWVTETVIKTIRAKRKKAKLKKTE